MDTVIETYLQDGLISPSSRSRYVSYLFAIPKSSASPRLIFNLSRLTAAMPKARIYLPAFTN